MEGRRRVPRVETDAWPARFFVQGEPHSGKECRVLDISIMGVGLEVSGEHPAQLVGRRLVVHVQAPGGASVGLRLVGLVRYASEDPSGAARAGLELDDYGETERQILEVLALVKSARWGWQRWSGSPQVSTQGAESQPPDGDS